MNPKILWAGGASIVLLGAIVASQGNLWAPPGLCRQCECGVYEADDAGVRLMRSVVLSFGAEDKDAGIEDPTDRTSGHDDEVTALDCACDHLVDTAAA
jgi:hypothetical protein